MDVSSGKRTSSAQTRLTVSAFSTSARVLIIVSSLAVQIPTGAGYAKGDGWVRRRPKVSPHRLLEMTGVTPRKVPGALILGLLASLLAHAGLYGGGHAMGGPYNGLLLDSALAGTLGLLAFFAALAWGQSGATVDGSIMAARLRQQLPGAPAVLVATGLWYVAGEAIEPHHAGASLIGSLCLIVVFAYAVLWLARIATAALARAVLAIARLSFSPRRPFRQRHSEPRPLNRRVRYSPRRFARPPPIALAFSRA
jgi:hypothetical protein